jgi:quercetin dioxygenase-like cupin family protein
MGVIHKFLLEEQRWLWQGVERKIYPSGNRPSDPKGVSVQWLIGRDEGAPFFAVRYFELEPGGQTILDRHSHDHGVFVLRGRGRVRLGEMFYELGFGDVVYIPGNEVHQFFNAGEDLFAFICVIPNKDHLRGLGLL